MFSTTQHWYKEDSKYGLHYMFHVNMGLFFLEVEFIIGGGIAMHLDIINNLTDRIQELLETDDYEKRS